MRLIPGLEGKQPIEYFSNDPLDLLVRRSGRFRVALRRPAYTIYRQGGTRCAPVLSGKASS
jgi:hypothetical protein